MRTRFEIPLRDGRHIELGLRTLIVGVLNVTPDSFSDGGRHFSMTAAIEHAHKMQEDGADIIEVGGESTRPGASALDEAEELARVLPVLKGISGLSVPLAIDTYKHGVAEAAIDQGVVIVNDVSALRNDPRLADVVARTQVALVLMHMRGQPATMQKQGFSEDIFKEITDDLQVAIAEAERRGVPRDRIVIDPGIGFGKSLDQNLAIIKGLSRFESFGLPLMIGTSRKGFVGRLTGKKEEERVFGTAASVAASILNGAHIVRVHDVKEMKDVVLVADAIARG